MIEMMYTIHEIVNSPIVLIILQLITCIVVILGIFSLIFIDKKK